MKQRIESLQDDVGRLMQKGLAGKSFDNIESLARMLAKAGKLKIQLDEIEMELTTLEKVLERIENNSSNANPTVPVLSAGDRVDQKNGDRAAPSTIRVQVKWRLNARNKNDEEIFSPIAAKSLAVFIGRLISEFGDSALQQLLKIRVNRGPLLSRNPERDFGGYSSKRVPGTDLFVLTNNTTTEKVEIIREICRELKLVPGSVTVEAEGRG